MIKCIILTSETSQVLVSQRISLIYFQFTLQKLISNLQFILVISCCVVYVVSICSSPYMQLQQHITDT